MDAATIGRLMAVIPERMAWAHSGSSFLAHEGQSAELRLLAPMLGWLSPLTALTKDEQRALGLLAAPQKPAADEEEVSAPGEEDVEPLEIVDDAPLGGARPFDALLPVVEAT